MSVWEYKVITSGKGGFASPALLESFLNQLGKEEWEILHFQSQPENPLAFTGIARRPIQRDWSLEDAAAAAARTEADKLRAEFEAKFKGGASSSEDKPEPTAPEPPAGEIRRLRDTESDFDPDAEQGEEQQDWDKLGSEDELPTFFDAIKPHLRRNQRGPGHSAGVEHLARKWDLDEEDVIGALKECGFAIPEDEDDPPVYIEYDGDLYWVNRNRRGELWINTKEKPRPVFRTVAGTPVAAEAAEGESAPSEAAAEPRHDRKGERRRSKGERAPEGPAEPLPQGAELLEKIVPHMRRNRDGSGLSGSLGYLSRALRSGESELSAAFAALGLKAAENAEDKPDFLEHSGKLWWLNRDHRGGVWINGREKEDGMPPEAAAGGNAELPLEVAQAAQADSNPEQRTALSAVRLLLKETKPGSFSAESGRLAEELGRSRDELLAGLVAAGLKVPEKPREKPVFVEHNGEILWLNRNAKDELWLNAKASKYADSDSNDDSRRRRGRKVPQVEHQE